VSYYPVLKVPGFIGWTTLSNFSPNNWEVTDVARKLVNVTWNDGGAWVSSNIGELEPGRTFTVSENDLAGLVPLGALPLLSLTNRHHPERSQMLPRTDTELTNYPAWRATLGLSSSKTSTSYQGEVDPFPAPGSLLTFAPMMQFGKEVKNFLIFLNVETSPVERKAVLEVYDSAKPSDLKMAFDVRNNQATVISLDGLALAPNDLPLMVCKGMSAIPLYLSSADDGRYLSFEHTHPPACYVIHGERWAAQRILKTSWFSRAGQ
jgi:hypothetical protein